jgi:hypothetical protein
MNKGKLTVEKDKNGTIMYRNADGELHNPHGPAIVWADGDKVYWINDEYLTEADFKAWQAQRTAPLHNKTKVIDGIEYTLTAK